MDDLDRRGVGLIMLTMGGQHIDTRSPTGKLMITMLAAIAEFERGLLLERQREGVAKGKADGKYKGRKPTARAKAAEVVRLDAEGLQRTEIARRTGIGVASVYRRSSRREEGCWQRKDGSVTIDPADSIATWPGHHVCRAHDPRISACLTRPRTMLPLPSIRPPLPPERLRPSPVETQRGPAYG